MVGKIVNISIGTVVALTVGGCCRGVNLDSEFARFWEPGRYTTLKSHSCK